MPAAQRKGALEQDAVAAGQHDAGSDIPHVEQQHVPVAFDLIEQKQRLGQQRRYVFDRLDADLVHNAADKGNEFVFRQDIRDVPAQPGGTQPQRLNEPPLVVQRVVYRLHVDERIIGHIVELVVLRVQGVYVRLGDPLFAREVDRRVAAHGGGELAGHADVQMPDRRAGIGFGIGDGVTDHIGELIGLEPFAIRKAGILALAYAAHRDGVVHAPLSRKNGYLARPEIEYSYVLCHVFLLFCALQLITILYNSAGDMSTIFQGRIANFLTTRPARRRTCPPRYMRSSRPKR